MDVTKYDYAARSATSPQTRASPETFRRDRLIGNVHSAHLGLATPIIRYCRSSRLGVRARLWVERTRHDKRRCPVPRGSSAHIDAPSSLAVFPRCQNLR